MRTLTTRALVASLALTSALTVPAGAQAGAAVAPEAGRGAAGPLGPGPQLQALHLPASQKYTLADGLRAALVPVAPQPAAAPAPADPPVGTTRSWAALDARTDELYPKDFVLRTLGRTVEVWVAAGPDGLRFPEGDCRNAVAGSTEVTAEQLDRLVAEVDEVIRPGSTAAFSDVTPRDGTRARLRGDHTGDGTKVVVLVDNVRDQNWSSRWAQSYVAGFFSAEIVDLFDRNILTLDAFDWAHATGAAPPDDPTSDPCTSRPARPRLYEGTFAHEYQHLLQDDRDPQETDFLDEGLSDLGTSLAGYADTRARLEHAGPEHLRCFHGFGGSTSGSATAPSACGGPQNSLTSWGDEGRDSNVLADYGAAWAFLLFLTDRYGPGLVQALHRDGERQGLASVQAQLDREAPGTRVQDVLRDFQTMTLLDRYVGEGGEVTGAASHAEVTTPSLRATVHLADPSAYARPGAAPNGADYVALRGANGERIGGQQLQSLSFAGAGTLPVKPLLWTSADDPPEQAGDPALWSGDGPDRDAAAVTRIDVPDRAAVLSFRERHLTEAGYDFAYTSVSTDDGETWTVLGNAATAQGPLGPGLTGDSGAFTTQTFDLAPYAGQSVLLSFRYVTDRSVQHGGWYVDDVRVGDAAVADGSTTASFRSPSQVRHRTVHDWHVRVVGLDPRARRAHVVDLAGRGPSSLSRPALAALRPFPWLVAIVSQEDPTGQLEEYAPYRLVVNGVRQPGGG